MTAAGTFPSDATDQKVQANIVAAKYDLPRLSLAPASALATPPGIQTFSPRSSQETTVTFKNTSDVPATVLNLNISVPARWASVVSGTTEPSRTFADPVAPGASVSATFKVTSGPAAFNGDLVANASWTANGNGSWTANGRFQFETATEKVRNISPIKINEFAVSFGLPTNSTDSFIELYNAGDIPVDISNWTLTQHPTQQPIFSSVNIPPGTKLAAKGFYLLGLANSGLAVLARKGDTTIFVRSTAGMKVGDSIEIDTGSRMELRKIATLGTAAGNSTTLWQPLPEGPVITIPVGSTNVPFTAAGGGPGGGRFAVEAGEKIGIGYGATYPCVAKAVEKYEVVTVAAVGRPGTQAWLAADSKAGDTNIKASSVANISAGDQIRLDIDSVGHGIETVTVTKVGTQSKFNPNNVRSGDTGTGLDLAEPLKFTHSANIPFSVRGTGISFQPPTAFAHSSNEPLQPLGTGITLDQPLANDHEINAAVRDAAVTTAGYQGPPAPNQWFGGPALANAGNMVLRDPTGLVVDSLNYGGLVDPWAAEGYQAESGAGRGGCSVPSPGGGRGGFGGFGGPPGGGLNRSAGRFPDGADTDSNCHDFRLQAATTLASPSAAEANNIKVASVADLSAGQMLIIDAGANREAAVIASVGTAGATTVRTNTEVGATVIPVVSAFGFSTGQTITIDSGANRETAVIASMTGARGFGGGGGRRDGAATITVASPLTKSHAADAQLSGSGITLATALTRAHESGTQVTGDLPTPGAPNQYYRRSQ
jgi:hypothetical protein